MDLRSEFSLIAKKDVQSEMSRLRRTAEVIELGTGVCVCKRERGEE